MRLFQRGFTLLETLIAMMIIAGAVIVLSNAWSGNFMRLRKTALLQQVSHLIERKMIEIDIKYRNDVASIPKEDKGDFDGYPKFRWELKSHEFEMPDLTPIIMAKADKGNGTSDLLLSTMRQVTEFIKQVVTEVTLTVFAKIGKKELPYAVTTYYVDYTKSIPMPGMGGTASATPGAPAAPPTAPAQPPGASH